MGGPMALPEAPRALERSSVTTMAMMFLVGIFLFFVLGGRPSGKCAALAKQQIPVQASTACAAEALSETQGNELRDCANGDNVGGLAATQHP